MRPLVALALCAVAATMKVPPLGDLKKVLKDKEIAKKLKQQPPEWGKGAYKAYFATPVERGDPITHLEGRPFELRVEEKYPSQNAKDGFSEGYNQGVASPPMGRTEAKTLYDDLTQPFDPTRVITEARRKIPTVGTAGYLIDGTTKKHTTNEISKELELFKKYLQDKQQHHKKFNLMTDPPFKQGTTPDMAAESNPSKSLFCNGNARSSGQKGLAGIWDVNKMTIGRRCSELGIAKELYTTGWPWYQMGLIAGWFDKVQHIDYARIYASVDLTHTVSFGYDVGVGHRSRGGGWHIDMSFDKKHENAPPLYFVSTDDHPTLFFKGRLADYMEQQDIDKLNNALCSSIIDCKSKYIEAIMGKAGTGGTYQVPYSHWPLLTDGTDQAENQPGWMSKGKTTADLKTIDFLKAEPPCQYLSGLINLKIFDAEMRTDLVNVCNARLNKAKQTAGDTCLPSASLEGFTLGPHDNPTGGMFRKHIYEQTKFTNLKDVTSHAYKEEIVEVPADLSVGLMGPYRIHNAGARKKTEKRTERDCEGMSRMFSRIMLIPTIGDDQTPLPGTGGKTSGDQRKTHLEHMAMAHKTQRSSIRVALRTKALKIGEPERFRALRESAGNTWLTKAREDLGHTD